MFVRVASVVGFVFLTQMFYSHEVGRVLYHASCLRDCLSDNNLLLFSKLCLCTWLEFLPDITKCFPNMVQPYYNKLNYSATPIKQSPFWSCHPPLDHCFSKSWIVCHLNAVFDISIQRPPPLSDHSHLIIVVRSLFIAVSKWSLQVKKWEEEGNKNTKMTLGTTRTAIESPW